MNWIFVSGGQIIGVSASVFPMKTEGWLPLGLTGLISLQTRGLLGVLSCPTIQKHQLFGAQLSLWSNSHTILDYWKNHSYDYTASHIILFLPFPLLFFWKFPLFRNILLLLLIECDDSTSEQNLATLQLRIQGNFLLLCKDIFYMYKNTFQQNQPLPA